MTLLSQRTDESSGWEITLYRMAFGNTRLCVGPPGVPWYDRGWCYQSAFKADALADAATWDGQGTPPGRWFKDLQTGETRDQYTNTTAA